MKLTSLEIKISNCKFNMILREKIANMPLSHGAQFMLNQMKEALNPLL